MHTLSVAAERVVLDDIPRMRQALLRLCPGRLVTQLVIDIDNQQRVAGRLHVIGDQAARATNVDRGFDLVARQHPDQ